jgi:putative Mg2+ transporter-C (MgtC) family protein
MDISFELQMLGKVIIASLLGGIVGLEREFAERPAGLRTHMLVGATSAFFVMLATHMIASFEPQDIVAVDPVRVVEAIVVGISFLGAGTIFKYTREGQGVVEGLTTSASIWAVAAIGIAVAIGAFVVAVGVTILNLFVNWGLAYFIDRVSPNKNKGKILKQ